MSICFQYLNMFFSYINDNKHLFKLTKHCSLNEILITKKIYKDATSFPMHKREIHLCNTWFKDIKNNLCPEEHQEYINERHVNDRCLQANH